MTKTELIKELTERTGLAKEDTKKVLETLSDVIVEVLEKGDKIKIEKVGSFSVKDVAERQCLANPKQPELGKKTLPAHKDIKFKKEKSITEKLNQ